MKKTKSKIFIGFLFLIFLFLGFVNAGFEVGNESHLIDNQYGPSDDVRGWINISLNNEPANSVFEDSLGNSISLIDLLLKQNQDFDYLCTTINCVSDYSAGNEEEIKTFNLDNKKSKIFGFKFNENIIAINSINFTVESDATTSCYNQLEIDFLNDGEINVGNNKSFGYGCSFLKSAGCFDDNESTNKYFIGCFPNKHCQRIKLSESSGFRIGAWVKKNSDSRILTMALYELNGDSVEGANCQLPEASEEGGEIFCDIDYLVTESKDYYVCIYSDEGNGMSEIEGYSKSDGCGFYGTGIQSEIAAFNIFVEGKMFDNVGTLEISNSLKYGNNFNGIVSDYVLEKYGGLDCSGNGCVVPIKFISGKNQEITIKNLKIEYETTLGPTTKNDFYNLSEIPATINSDFQKLYLDKGDFSLASGYGNFTFQLKLDNTEIFSEEMVTEKVPIIKSLTPKTTASAFPTLFEVIIDSSGNITKYEWDFGNNDSKTTTTNKIIYTYDFTGQYELKITVTDSNQRSSYKIFNIIVNSPEKEINQTLKKKLEDLTNVNTQIKSFPVFYQENLNSILKFEFLEEELKKIQTDYMGAVSEDDYNKVMTDLLNLNIPESVSISKSADSILFYPEKSSINLNILQTIGGGSYDAGNEDEYINAIFSWNQKNMETKITFKELSVRYGSSEEPILKVFELKINKKNNSEYSSYLILRELDELKFKENYSENKESKYVYIDLTGSEKTIEFSTTEDINFVDLPVFISPGLDRLIIAGESINGKEKKISKWVLFILILFLLAIIGFIVYIVLQEWYKKKYENYLFRNRNNLYNIITYINNAKKKGLENEEISIKLKKAGWNSEQVKYVMKKYSGKRTGMFEIPIEKILSKFKKKNIQQQKTAISPNQNLHKNLYGSSKPQSSLAGEKTNKKIFFKK